MRACHTTVPADEKAEGVCKGLPYNTDLVSINGVNAHFWVGNRTESEREAALAIAIPAIRNERDVVSVSWSEGEPAGFWAHQDIP